MPQAARAAIPARKLRMALADALPRACAIAVACAQAALLLRFCCASLA
jgi:hypothetical protein